MIAAARATVSSENFQEQRRRIPTHYAGEVLQLPHYGYGRRPDAQELSGTVTAGGSATLSRQSPAESGAVPAESGTAR